MRKSLAYLLLHFASLVKIMKPYRREPVNKLGCANTGVHSTAWRMMYFGLLHRLIWCKITKILHLSSLVFVLCSYGEDGIELCAGSWVACVPSLCLVSGDAGGTGSPWC